MRSLLKSATALAAVCAAALIGPAAHAGSAQSQLQVQLTILPSCTVSSANPMDFGSVGSLTGAINASTSILVNCTQGTQYWVAADGGGTQNIAARAMTGGMGAPVSYQLYQDAGHLQVWGNTGPAVDEVPGFGVGSATPVMVYGQVPPQTTPAPGSYSDYVNVTVNY
jgi:spore coat protein U-like protein